FPVSAKNQFQVSAKSIPATSIGGDFYDFIENDSERLGIVMGDVSGKGVPAALYMARLVSDFRFHSQIRQNVCETLAIINDLLVERGRRGMFVTLQYLVAELATGRVEVASAGHLPALHVLRDGRGCKLIENHVGVPLGILPGINFASQTIQLEHGDYLVSFTDGIIEAKNKKGEQFSLQRLIKFLNRPWATPDDIVNQLIKEIKHFTRGASQHDDLTVTAFKWC
ncbi:MAG: serine/threonine-protein phosphatase, partial [Calditrichaeota bacterium]